MEQIYLTRRNLLSLLNKLDRKAEGEDTACTLIKRDNQHPKYPQTLSECSVTAVEDVDYYSHRSAGEVLPVDDPNIKWEDVEENDDVYTISEFIDAVAQGAFTDYDGYGVYALNGKKDVTAEHQVVPSDIPFMKLRQGYTHIVWYNK